MNTNISNPGITQFFGVDGTQAKNQFVINSGAAGWITTDISGSDVARNAKVIWIRSFGAAASDQGCRQHSGTGFHISSSGYGSAYPVLGDGTLSIDLWRDAAQNNTYYMMGYET